MELEPIPRNWRTARVIDRTWPKSAARQLKLELNSGLITDIAARSVCANFSLRYFRIGEWM